MKVRSLRICLDTNVWIDATERKIGLNSEKAKKLMEKLTNLKSPHKLIIPFLLKLELIHKILEGRKENFLVKTGKCTTYDLKTKEGKELIFKTKLSPRYQREIDNFFKDLETSKAIEITKPPISFFKVEILVKENFEILDSLIIIQANESNVDYFVTRDRIARKINSLKFKWLKLKATSPSGMLKILKNLEVIEDEKK